MEQAYLRRMVLKLQALHASILYYKHTLQDNDPCVKDVKGKLCDCKDLLGEVGLPKHKSRIVDFTDAGPGVGITNHEVKMRSLEEIRIMNYDYYVRHHLAPGDSSHNEVERIQSYVGMSLTIVLYCMIWIAAMHCTALCCVQLKSSTLKN
jgi:hypothetical protein